VRSAARDLIVLVADKNTDYGLRGLLRRPQALGTRPIEAQIVVHPRRDPGCRREAHNFLRAFTRDFQRALVIFDRDGSGYDGTREALENDLSARLNSSGWDGRSEVVVIDPELEIWVFAPSPHVEHCLEWPRNRGRVRAWLERQGAWGRQHQKPHAPRDALEQVLRAIQRPRSSTLYECLGARVGLRQCSDRAFQKLVTTLRTWFPPDGADSVGRNAPHV
jgi:hypothetical protein